MTRFSIYIGIRGVYEYTIIRVYTPNLKKARMMWAMFKQAVDEGKCFSSSQSCGTFTKRADRCMTIFVHCRFQDYRQGCFYTLIEVNAPFSSYGSYILAYNSLLCQVFLTLSFCGSTTIVVLAWWTWWTNAVQGWLDMVKYQFVSRPSNCGFERMEMTTYQRAGE